MGQSRFWKKLTEDINAVAALPLVELAGSERILIENHKGIGQYGRECIVIKMAYGQLKVSGSNMELAQITRQQLVISGKVASLTVLRNGEV